MKRMHDIEITSEGVFINGQSLPGGGSKLYKHALSGTTSTMDNVVSAVDYNPDPITNANFPTRMENSLLIKSSTRTPFIAGYASQNGEHSCSMLWVNAGALQNLTIDYTNVSDVVTEI